MTTAEHPLYEQAWPEGEYRFFQLGYVVDDIVSSARQWASTFGVGPSAASSSVVIAAWVSHATFGL